MIGDEGGGLRFRVAERMEGLCTGEVGNWIAGELLEPLGMATMIAMTSLLGFVPGIIGYRVRALRESDG